MKINSSNIFAIVILLLFYLQIIFSGTKPLAEVRGVWLSRSVISRGRESIHSAFEELKSLGYNTVFVNTWYKGKTIYPSQVLENHGVDNQLSAYGGWDPLKVAIEEGHRIGIKVHAWFEYGLVGGYAYSEETPEPIGIPAKHPEWLMQDREEVPFYTPDGYNYQYWIDPASDQGKEFIVKIFEECAQKYPDIDGIQTDRFRYPNPEYSFSTVSRNKYQEDTGGSDPVDISKNDDEWSQFTDWREKQITNVADTVYKVIKSANPDCIVSAAVVPPYMMSGGSDKMQNWGQWYANSSIDWLVPMLYGLHGNISYWINQCQNIAPTDVTLLPGISLDGMSGNDLENVISTIRNMNCGGQVVWYWGYLDSQNKARFQEIYDPFVPSLEDLVIIDNESQFYTDFNNMSPAEGGLYGTMHSGEHADSWFEWKIPVFESGEYQLATYLASDTIEFEEIEYEIHVSDIVADTSIDANTQSNDPWHAIADLELSYSDSLTVRTNSSNSNLVADAIKLEKRKNLRIIEGFAFDENNIILKFNQNVQSEAASNPANYEISPHTEINKINTYPSAPSVVNLVCDNLQNSVDYTIKTWDQESEDGRLSDTIGYQIKFQGKLTELIDNKDELFKVLSGEWIEEVNSKVKKGSYLKTRCGDGDSKVYWRYPVPEAGYYEIQLFFPDSNKFASDANFVIRKGNVTDTLKINQQTAYPEGYKLDPFWIGEGRNLVIILSNQSEHSADYWVVADAVKIKRVLSTALKDKQENNRKIEEVFKLYPNYPNPFNSITTLGFSLRQNSDVKLRIYNLQGKLMKKYLLQNKRPGYQEIRININDLSSGFYFYKFKVQGKSKIGKMTLIK